MADTTEPDPARAGRPDGSKTVPTAATGFAHTLINTGSRGARFDMPNINQPRSAILRSGAVVKRPVVITMNERLESDAFAGELGLG